MPSCRDKVLFEETARTDAFVKTGALLARLRRINRFVTGWELGQTLFDFVCVNREQGRSGLGRRHGSAARWAVQMLRDWAKLESAASTPALRSHWVTRAFAVAAGVRTLGIEQRSFEGHLTSC